MKNYLVKSLFQVKDSNWYFKDRSDETDLYKKYIEMHQLSVGSFTRHLKGQWELKVVQGTVDNINDAFKQTFRAIYDQWRQGDVNIFYTDPDTIAIKDIDPWQISNQFLMFNFTDPNSLETENHYGRKFPHFFNAGVRYFPADMDQRIWNIGLSMLDQWEEGTYNTEQIILNAMLWDQGVTLDQVLRPEWAYQAQWLPNQAPLWLQDVWNGIDINRAMILHLHSSRNIDEKLAFMKQIRPGMKDIFTNIVHNGYWRAGTTVCGNGSTMQYTDYLRKTLGGFLQKHNITSMFDAPCGDYGWMSVTPLPRGHKYIGGDIVNTLIEKNSKQYPDIDFRVFDISKDPLPDVDLLFCRDCLIHFSHGDIRLVFENIARSNIKYVMMTSYHHSDNTDINTGGFRGVDFLRAPYVFEKAIDCIEDWIPGFTPRSMCLWSRETIIGYLEK